jgi:TolA-binding protein
VVVGTEFLLDWDGATERMSLRVTKGLVEVRSGGRVIPVGAGQQLAVDSVGHRLTAVEGPEGRQAPAEEAVERPVPEEPKEEEAAPEASVLPRRPVVSAPAHSSAVSSAPRRAPGHAEDERSAAALPEWKELLLANEYAAAVDAAERAGFDRLVSTVSAADLQKLGDAARLMGPIGRARQALLGVRQRFPASGEAALSAYSLGRLASDRQNNDREAVKWFRTYLKSGGSGPLAAGARGRLMDALLRLGDRKGAQQVARDYLKYHPKGRHARVAESLIDHSTE